MRLLPSAAGRRALISALAVATLAGCAVGPDFTRPAPPDADRYGREPTAAATAAADGSAQRFISGAAVNADWWRLFKSASLDAAVRAAIANNPTLQASEATLRQSQNNLRAGYGVFFPQVDVGFSATRQRTEPLLEGVQSAGSVFNLMTLGGTISYALDVFGGERRMVEGLRAQVDYQRHAKQAAYLTLTANVVNTVIARAAYAAEIRANEQLIELLEQQVKITEAQFRSGTVAYASVLSVRAALAANRATLAPLQQRISQADHLLATLEGALPSRALLPDVELAGLMLPIELPVSLPSELVHQRPDILSAEAQLHVASANVGVATAALYPSFSLTGSYGGASTGFGDLLSARGRFWSIGPSVTIPVFHGGTLWYGRKAAIDAFDASQAVYRQVVLDAFAQVADALDALGHDAEALQAQEEARLVAGQALHLLQANYGAGMVAYLDVLVADVQYHQAIVAYLQAVALRQQDTVALFVALGGGWWNEPPPTASGTAP
jgi:NodT family efflux transporter outer membrane factor (OMF) lipoprotein